MKTATTTPSPASEPLTGPRYWRSLDEYSDNPAFKTWLHREFPQGASEAEGVNRRGFMKLMATGFAAAGLGAAGCRRPESYILPYSRQDSDGFPESTIPGIPVYYASSYPDGLDNVPLLVETHQNRPTHLEGNPSYEPYGGAANAFATASILHLYDADRLTRSTEGIRPISQEEVKDVIAGLAAEARANGGQEMAILARPSTSPTRRRLKSALKQAYPRMRWCEYAPVPQDGAEKAATAALGRPARPLYKLAKAKRVLALDADFLNHHEPGSNALARDFAKTRKVKDKADAKKMSRLYTVESAFTVTGAMADHRLRLGSTQMAAFAAILAVAVLEKSGAERGLISSIRNKISDINLSADELGWIDAAADDLVAAKGHAVVIPGSHLPAAAQHAVMLINHALGAEGQTVEYVAPPADDNVSLADLTARLRTGAIGTLLILDGNPVYDAPADLDLPGALAEVGQIVRFGSSYDETSALAAESGGTLIAASHFLEGWSDGRAFDGTYLPVQPMIEPLFSTFNELEVLARLAGMNVVDALAQVRETFAELVPDTDKEKAFNRFLSVGFLAGSMFPAAELRGLLDGLKAGLSRADFSAPTLSSSALEVRLVKDDSVGDGTFANNGWMQECPDPMTKLTWDNVMLISPALAEHLGYDTKSGEFLIGGIAKRTADFKRGREQAPVAELTVDGTTIRGPVQIMPGLADWSVVIPLGYGRKQVGRIGKGAGFDAYPLTKNDAFFLRDGASISLTGEMMQLANTQEHWSMEGRAILREGTTKQFAKNTHFATEIGMESHSPAIYGKAQDKDAAYKALKTPRGASQYEIPDFGKPPPNVDVWKSDEAREQFIPEQQWGMSIDLNTCTGCNACIVACQSENNIPIVGKDQVMRGRELHWIRLDRYYTSGDNQANRSELPRDPQASLMPLGCVHCENAPCEQVCPVNATVHDSQGLNVMAYNRCVGTRYCANNCPYKVRRFNFFDYNKRAIDDYYKGPLATDQHKTEGGQLAGMQKNPDVTVRMRGVMEKCTFCVQRIQQGKMAQKVQAKDSNDIHVPDGLIRTACQNACPTEAIAFGDIADPTTAVAQAKANDRDYSLLGYLNTRPRTTYLARLRNPNPEMPAAYQYDYAFSYKEYKEKQPAGAGHSDHGHGDAHAEPAAHDDHGHG